MNDPKRNENLVELSLNNQIYFRVLLASFQDETQIYSDRQGNDGAPEEENSKAR